MCRGDRGDFGVIVCWRDFHDVRPDDIEVHEAAQHRQQLPSTHAARLGCPGPWGMSRIKDINVD